MRNHSQNKNISELLRTTAFKYPNNKAIVFSSSGLFGKQKYRSYKFDHLEQLINRFANKLISLGVEPGHRVLFFVKPNLDFSAITFALFRIGAIPVFVDPGMKKQYFLNTIKNTRPDVLVGIPKIHFFRRMHSKIFSNIKIFISTGACLGFSTKSLYRGLKKQDTTFDIYIPKKDDLAAILYTSGGTGEPKGVEYTHDIFINQTLMLQSEFNLQASDIDIAGFPLFSFFTLAMGMTSVIPNMDFSKPSACNPEHLYQNIKDNHSTFLAGSPAIWERLADYCLQEKLKLPFVKYVVMFGAPVSMNIHKKFKQILANGTTYTPYGSTECLPVSNISGEFLLANKLKDILSGKGTCVGRPIGSNKIKIIKSIEGPITQLRDTTVVSSGEVGEIIVNGPNITKAYFDNIEATNLSKISDGKDVWHRMGDVGFLDSEGLLWFCGRKSHVVEIDGRSLFPIPVETIFNQHPKIKRSALVKNTNTNKPILLIERVDKKTEIEPMFLMDLKNISQTHFHTKTINDFHAIYNFPVDIRHNIKIDRTKLQKDFLGKS